MIWSRNLIFKVFNGFIDLTILFVQQSVMGVLDIKCYDSGSFLTQKENLVRRMLIYISHWIYQPKAFEKSV